MYTELPKQRHSKERVKTDFTGAPGDSKLSDLQQACKLSCLETQCMHKSCGTSLFQALSSSDSSGALPPATTAANRPPPGYLAGRSIVFFFLIFLLKKTFRLCDNFG